MLPRNILTWDNLVDAHVSDSESRGLPSKEGIIHSAGHLLGSAALCNDPGAYVPYVFSGILCLGGVHGGGSPRRDAVICFHQPEREKVFYVAFNGSLFWFTSSLFVLYSCFLVFFSAF